jgi:hypothetical protein
MNQLKVSWQDRLTVLLKSGCGVSLAYFEFLSAIQRLGCCELDEIATELPASPSVALELLRKGEERGDCQLSPWRYPTYMRRIRLTSKGRALVTVAGDLIDSELIFLFGSVPNSRVRDLNGILNRLRTSDYKMVV